MHNISWICSLFPNPHENIPFSHLTPQLPLGEFPSQVPCVPSIGLWNLVVFTWWSLMILTWSLMVLAIDSRISVHLYTKLYNVWMRNQLGKGRRISWQPFGLHYHRSNRSWRNLHACKLPLADFLVHLTSNFASHFPSHNLTFILPTLFYHKVPFGITLLRSYMMVSFQRKRLWIKNLYDLQLLVKKFIITTWVLPIIGNVVIKEELCSCVTRSLGRVCMTMKLIPLIYKIFPS